MKFSSPKNIEKSFGQKSSETKAIFFKASLSTESFLLITCIKSSTKTSSPGSILGNDRILNTEHTKGMPVLCILSLKSEKMSLKIVED
ncbi:hypothetical protein McpCs1_03920 [Methanocorpusculaceae archaeon Cs1]|uniref:Uncharacterized protein n=1 Tax=Methanorbis rubei TaxID=3028300 RepID=A0AAE4MF71_9EURY|nr:hypothetical protein [Methanocorpusculaceae archaeon Cs1]